ncbi:MAG TPA: D-alanyl-D-alanine carboxypeptidase/D-alanyl-D-alanine-endopeptidase, partial [Gemmatimonadaceae bacterium]|nr:D-alanyl-D-alanine carboxypeptidase/D-alanyl-D-alanine-endopeptidase [Gemmatimonadaceae bacterium]
MNASCLRRVVAAGAIAVSVMVVRPATGAGFQAQAPGSASSTAKTAQRARPWGSPGSSEQLATELGDALANHTKSGQWGAIVVSLTHGDTLFAANADAPMAPASTMKVFTSCIALDRFGPNYVFRTPVLREGALGSDGVLHGNLYLRGVGDPSLSPRFWKTESPMDALAEQVAAAGVRHVRGDLVGDASAFDGQLIPDGWKKSYLSEAYAAPVSALSLDENVVTVVVAPDGATAAVSLDPPTTTIPVHTTVKLVAGTRGAIVVAKQAEGAIVVRGTIGAHASPRRYSVVVDDPPLFTIGALRAALQRAGVTVDGTTRLGSVPSDAVSIAAIASPPLGDIIGEMNRESINLLAEMLFRDAAMSPLQQGSASTALATLRQFMTQKVGAPADGIDVSDGSGLSELDRVTARTMVEALHYAHESPWSATFQASLPVEGESGTLKNRAKGTPARGNLQ